MFKIITATVTWSLDVMLSTIHKNTQYTYGSGRGKPESSPRPLLLYYTTTTPTTTTSQLLAQQPSHFLSRAIVQEGILLQQNSSCIIVNSCSQHDNCLRINAKIIVNPYLMMTFFFFQGFSLEYFFCNMQRFHIVNVS